ncbi:MAG: hypothetical protein GWN85_37045, partial [Gemmatimonadetes bacterium]|nr:hypothetical protein [Gemmatimonadota bacterium]NIR39448.1 hypothetical protein [Actinomycetota bacterium]NIW30827.1 hypothetical protein [Actinomycetota bacterium]NIX23213.1 hypothetical protein [Actinomycetota bacterium]
MVAGLPCLVGVWLALGLATGAGVGAAGAKGLPGSCGDLRLDPGETCDDGNRADGDGCEADCGPPDPTLIAAYAFEEIAGRTVLDASGGGADGTLVGGARRSRFGVHGSALLLDGATGHAELGTLPTATNELTVSLWLRPDRFDVFDAILVARGGGTSDPAPDWVVGTFGPRLHFELRSAGHSTSLTAASTTLAEGVWTHVAARYDGTNMTLFQDGKPVRSTSKRGAMGAEPDSAVWLGDLPGG